MIHAPLTKLQCCPTSDGAGAAILASEEFVHKHGLEAQAVEIVAQAMVTDMPSSFEDRSSMKIVGYDMTKKAAAECFRKAGMYLCFITFLITNVDYSLFYTLRKSCYT